MLRMFTKTVLPFLLIAAYIRYGPDLLLAGTGGTDDQENVLKFSLIIFLILGEGASVPTEP